LQNGRCCGILTAEGLRIERRCGIAIHYHNGGDDCHFLPFSEGRPPWGKESQIRHIQFEISWLRLIFEL